MSAVVNLAFHASKTITTNNVLDLCKQTAGNYGAATGIEEIERLHGPLLDGQLVVIGARPGTGKTALLVRIAAQLALHESKRIFWLTLDEALSPLAERISGSMRSLETLPTGTCEINAALARIELSDDPTWIDFYSLASLLRARPSATRPQLLIIDGTSDNLRQPIQPCFERLSFIAKKLHIPVLATVTLRRVIEMRPDKHPKLADLREYRRTPADAIWLLYRGGLYERTLSPTNIELYIAKHPYKTLESTRFDLYELAQAS